MLSMNHPYVVPRYIHLSFTLGWLRAAAGKFTVASGAAALHGVAPALGLPVAAKDWSNKVVHEVPPLTEYCTCTESSSASVMRYSLKVRLADPYPRVEKEGDVSHVCVKTLTSS